MAFCTNCGTSVAGAFCTKCGTPVASGGAAAQAQPAPQPTAPPYQAAPPYQGPPQYAAAPAPPAMGPRKTSPIIWILVILAGLFVLGGVAVVGTGLFVAHKVRQAGLDPDLMQRNPGLAVTKLLAAVNPGVEVLNTDDGNGRITIRDRKTGKVMTMSFDDARNGRFSFSAEDENGKTARMEFGGSASKLPSWIPAYPGSNPQVAITASGDEGEGGTFNFNTSDSPEKVMQFYQEKFKDMGMQVTNFTSTSAGGMVTGADDNTHRTLNVIVGRDSGNTSVNVTYGKK